MHTLKLDIEGVTWVIHHNGDWSGEAIVCELEEPKAGSREPREAKREVTLPAQLFAQACRQAVLDEVIAAIEQL